MAEGQAIKIGDAAAALGIEAHVLRHWESVGLLTPKRSRSEHRTYDEQALGSARMIQVLQRAGLSLAQIGQLGRSAHEERLALVAAHRAEVRDQVAVLRATDQFLEHVTDCRHPVIAECPDCADFASL